MKINLLDLFSGIGGFHLGLSQAGFKVNSYYSEIDKYAIKTYNYNFKNSTYVGSVTNIQRERLPKRIHGITFGSPCQDFSLAGKRKGLDGDRSSLIGEAINLISQLKPDFFIWENVKGTFSSNNGEDFWAIIKAFTDIGGYRLEWQLLNTSWFLPQNRERIYLVGYTPNKSRGQIFPITKVLELGKYSLTKTRKHNKIARALSARASLGADDNYIKVNSNTKKGYEIANPGDSISYSNPNSKTRRGRVGKQQSQTLDTSCNQAVYNNENVRRLTPIECERLQGFPDNWTLAKDNSDTQRYKMIGNAVTVDVVKAVGERIIKTLY
jgi:DNA (cytosine-5)-methyltransferase 1